MCSLQMIWPICPFEQCLISGKFQWVICLLKCLFRFPASPMLQWPGHMLLLAVFSVRHAVKFRSLRASNQMMSFFLHDLIDRNVCGDHFVYAPSQLRWRYIVTSSLIGWAYTQNDPCIDLQYAWYLASGAWGNIIIQVIITCCCLDTQNALCVV